MRLGSYTTEVKAWVDVDIDYEDVLDDMETEDIYRYLETKAYGAVSSTRYTCHPCNIGFNVLFHLNSDKLKVVHCPICGKGGY